MTRLIPFDYAHLRMIRLQPQQQFLADAVIQREAQLRAMPKSYAFTLIDGGVILGSGGMIPTWPGRAQVWAMLDCEAITTPRRFLPAHRAAKQVLGDWMKHLRLHTLETTVRADYEGGMRWARKLGFLEMGPIALYPPVPGINLVAFSRFNS